MKKLLSIKYSAGAFNVALLFLRIVVGVLMMNHGYGKLVHFQEYAPKTMDFMGFGHSASLSLLIFAEFFCSLFIILGLFTRIAAIPLIISSAIALFVAHKHDVFGAGEMITLFLISFFVILLLGPGRVSVDGLIAK